MIQPSNITPDDIPSDMEVTVLVNESESVIKHDIPHERLLKALYWVWDAFDRSMVDFFLINQTYKDARKNKDLSGDKLEIGIRRMEWVGGGRRLLDTFMGLPLEETPTVARYEYEGVPVLLHIYDDSDCITALDSLVYAREIFKIPNPYSKFEEIYG